MELLDASAIINLAIQSGEEAADFLRARATLDLAFYESGNAVWKLCAVQKKMAYEQAKSLVETIARLIAKMQTVPFVELRPSEVMTFALDERLSYYDAAYVFVGKSRNLVLVTDDDRLAKAASKHIQTMNSRQFRRS